MKTKMFPVLLIFTLQIICLPISAPAQEEAVEINRLDTVLEITEAIDETRVAQIIGEISGAMAVADVEGDYTINTRHTFSAGNELARRYLIDRLKELGLDPIEDELDVEWSGRTTETANIVADIPGASPELVLCTAHFDSTASSEDDYYYAIDPAPGADDNATGVAACLIVAEQLADRQLEKTVRIVLFSGEEQGLFGSRHYAATLGESGAAVAGLVNIDMIGPEPYTGHDFLPILFRDHGEQGMFDPAGLAELFYQVGNVYETGLDIRPYWGAVVFNSDQFPFWYSDYPAVFINHGSNSDGYHSYADTLDTVDVPYVTASIKAIVAAIAHRAGIEGQAVIDIAGEQDDWEQDESSAGSGCSQVNGNSAVGLALLTLIPFVLFFRRSMKARRAVIQLLAIILLTTACVDSSANDDEIDDMVAHMIEKGKALLIDSDTTGARRIFAEILENYDPQNADAMFGMAFCDTLDIVELINMLGAYMLDSPTAKAAFSSLQVDPEQALTLYAEEIFGDIEQTAARNIDYLSACTNGDFKFDISGLPFYFLVGEKLFLDLEIVGSDVKMIRALWQLLYGLSSYIGAHDFDAPILTRYEQTDSADSYGYVPYINMIVALLGDSPTFLDFKGDGEGASMTEQARAAFEGAFADLAASLDEKKLQSDLDRSLIRYVADGEYSYYVLGGISATEAEKDNYLIDFRAGHVDYLIGSLLVVRDSFAGTGRAMEIPGNDISFLIPLVELMLKIFYPDLVVIDQDFVLTTITAYIPRTIMALDLAKFFAADAKSLRYLLPAYRTSTVFEENIFLFEWECTISVNGVDPYPNGRYGLFCHSSSTPVDREHFTDAIYLQEWNIEPLAADGVESSAPYLPLPDPTFNGMLSLDGYPLNVSGDVEGIVSADNYTLNAILATTVAQLF